VSVGTVKALLFVDDEPSLVEFVTELFEDEGYKMHGEQDAHTALAVFLEDPDAFDLIITDQTMPGMLGTEFARSVRAVNTTIPIILCTGFSDEIAQTALSEKVVDAMLQKPVRAVSLIEAVEAHLS